MAYNLERYVMQSGGVQAGGLKKSLQGCEKYIHRSFVALAVVSTIVVAYLLSRGGISTIVASSSFPALITCSVLDMVSVGALLYLVVKRYKEQQPKRHSPKVGENIIQTSQIDIQLQGAYKENFNPDNEDLESYDSESSSDGEESVLVEAREILKTEYLFFLTPQSVSQKASNATANQSEGARGYQEDWGSLFIALHPTVDQLNNLVDAAQEFIKTICQVIPNSKGALLKQCQQEILTKQTVDLARIQHAGTDRLLENLWLVRDFLVTRYFFLYHCFLADPRDKIAKKEFEYFENEYTHVIEVFSKLHAENKQSRSSNENFPRVSEEIKNLLDSTVKEVIQRTIDVAVCLFEAIFAPDRLYSTLKLEKIPDKLPLLFHGSLQENTTPLLKALNNLQYDLQALKRNKNLYIVVRPPSGQGIGSLFKIVDDNVLPNELEPFNLYSIPTDLQIAERALKDNYKIQVSYIVAPRCSRIIDINKIRKGVSHLWAARIFLPSMIQKVMGLVKSFLSQSVQDMLTKNDQLLNEGCHLADQLLHHPTRTRTSARHALLNTYQAVFSEIEACRGCDNLAGLTTKITNMLTRFNTTFSQTYSKKR